MPLARPHKAANITAAGGAVANRRSILVSGAQLAGAAALMPCMMGPAALAASNAEAATQGSGGAVRLAQAGAPGSRAARESRFADRGEIGGSAGRQSDPLCLCRQGGAVGFPQRPRGL